MPWLAACASSGQLPGPDNASPTAVIDVPLDGSTFTDGSAIAFVGSGADPEEGVLAGASLRWVSSLDGEIGTGSSFSTASLSIGDHEITLTATDSRGASATASISIAVTAASAAGPWAGAVSYGPLARERLKVKRPLGSATVPIFMHIPGGGWQNHSLNSCDFDSDRLVRETQWALVCVDFPPSSQTFTHPQHEQSVARAFDYVIGTLAPQHNLDASAVVAYGGSAGGHLAYRLAQLREGQLLGVGAQAAPTCLTNWDVAAHGVDSRCPTLTGSAATGPVAALLGPGATPDDGWDASPLREFTKLPPVHIQHIVQDPVVPISQARVMRDSLAARGAALDYHEFQITQQCEHGCSYFGHGNQLRDWLATLRGGGP